MEEQGTFTVDDLSFVLPEGWHEHTDGSEAGVKKFAINTQVGSVRLSVQPVEQSQAMPYGQDQAVVDIINQ